jgi:DNA-binding transcriptional LysR family regulator
VAAVVEQGSVSLAAWAVDLTRPAVTQGVAKLEVAKGYQRLSHGFYQGPYQRT